MEKYHQAEGMTTGIVGGEGINGTTKKYLISKFDKTGGDGRKTDIGRSRIIGVSRG
jgi:hypothetical protein